MLKRYYNSSEIMSQESIVQMLMEIMVSPTIGRIKSACEAVYNKQQGRFYAIEQAVGPVAILGYRIIDRTCELLHVKVDTEALTMEEFKAYLQEALLLDGLEEAHIVVNEGEKPFYKQLGFQIKPYKENDLGFDRFYCTLKI